jgi:lysyl endopeptidase
MKKQILTSVMGLGIIFCTTAQISEGGIPTSFRKTLVDETSIFNQPYHVHTLTAPDMNLVEQEDAENDVKGKPYRVGINIPVSYNMFNSGTWITLDNGDKIWRMGIRIPAATGLSLYFSEPVQIPAGGKLHAYNEKHSQYVGAYTSNTPTFQAMEIIQGDFLTLEYYMPAGSFELPVIEINEIAYYYRGFESRLQVFEQGDAIMEDRLHGSCEVDAMCSESTGHTNQRSSAVHYSFVAGGTYVCSGAVVNNTDNDCTPYILSANHCGEPDASSDITGHVWYFNYQRPNCSSPGNTATYTGAMSQTMSGGTFRASSSLGTHPASSGSQVDGADFVLVELNASIPAGYNPYFSGWSRSTTAATSGVCYHHPAGDEKKISTYSSSLSSATYNGGWSNAHWEVQWVATANGHGVTEGGSSGSPIYDQNNRIVGHLSGGSSYCSTPNNTDLYGKFNQAWSNDGSGNSSRLQPWLDPGGTGAMTLDGTFAPCAPVAPTADFVASATNITPSTTVTFTDLSSGSPTSWAWVVAPAAGWAYTGGTNATSQNPQITFNTIGSYTITLTATNTQGSDSETKTNYIVVAASTGPCNSTSTQSCTATDEFISIVEFNTINNNTACGNYTNYSAISTTVTKGSSYDLTITPAVGTADGTAYTNDELAAWIDWNDDNDFNDTNEEVAYVLVASGWSSVFNVTVPLTAVTGSVVMRVKLSYNPDDGDIDPCAATQWGETEDYVVNIQAAGSSEIGENNLGAVEIYPNPTNGMLTVDLTDVESDILSVELRDVTGRIISSTNVIAGKVNLNLSTETAGIYFVKVNAVNGSITRKIVKL